MSDIENNDQAAADVHAPLPPTVNVSPPPGLKDSGDLIEQWKIFKASYGYYAVIAQLSKQPRDYQYALFMHTIGPKGIQLYKVLTFEDDEDEQDVDLIMKKLDEHIIGELNVIYERYQFNNRNQQEGESIDKLVSALMKQTKTCEFCDCLRDELIRDRIVVGIKKDATRKKLLTKKKLTLKAAIDICRCDEATDLRLTAMSAEGESVNRLKHNYPRKDHDTRRKMRSKSKQRGYRGTVTTKECRFCGHDHEMKKDKCPAWGKKCDGCGKLNHFKAKCRARTVHLVNHDSSDSEVERIVNITTQPDEEENVNIAGESKKDIHATMIIHGQAVTVQIDCGATTSIMPMKYLSNETIQTTKKGDRNYVSP